MRERETRIAALPFRLFLLLLHRRAAAQAEIVRHAGGIPAQHGLHDPYVAVDVHGIAAVQLVQLVLEARHDTVHGFFDLGLGLTQILAADTGLLEGGVVFQQLQRGGQVVVQELARRGPLVLVVLDGLENAAGDLLQPVDLGAERLVGDAVVQVAYLMEDTVIALRRGRGFLGLLGGVGRGSSVACRSRCGVGGVGTG